MALKLTLYKFCQKKKSYNDNDENNNNNKNDDDDDDQNDKLNWCWTMKPLNIRFFYF